MKEKLSGNTKIIILIVGIIITIIGVTYSFIAPLISGVETESTIAFGSGTIKITYNGNNTITAENIIPRWSETKEFTIVGYNNTTINNEDLMEYAIKLVVEDNTFTAGAIKFELTGSSTNDNDTLSPLTGKVPTGTGETQIGTARFSQDENIKNEVTHTYSLTISFPNNPNKSQNEDMNKSLSAHIIVEQGKLYIPTFSDYISNLDYEDNGLKEDEFGNLRYVGASPNNYILFNNETWRIIGIVDGYVKIISEESKKIYWNTSSTNDWTTASLQEYLNGTYYNILSEDAQSQITKVTWHLGGWNTKTVSVSNIYKYERGIGSTGTIGEEYHVYTGNPTTWIGNIALMYPSDYGYASTDSTCRNSISSKNSSYDGYCSYNNWIYDMLDTKKCDEGMQYFITHYNLGNYVIYYMNCVGSIGTIPTNYMDGPDLSNPTLHLSSNVTRVSGDGTSTNQYQITLKTA